MSTEETTVKVIKNWPMGATIFDINCHPVKKHIKVEQN